MGKSMPFGAEVGLKRAKNSTIRSMNLENLGPYQDENHFDQSIFLAHN